MQRLTRVDYFQDVVERFTRPELEMHDEKLLRDYFHEGTLLSDELDQLHVLVHIPPPFLRVYCSETKRMLEKKKSA